MKNNTILQTSIYNYGNYSSDNYGAHSLCVELGSRKFYYSYQTLVAFKGTNSKGEHFSVIHQNDWGNTTGKHLNWIDGGSKEAKAKRVEDNEFNKQLIKFMK